jgi:hypothetical protein
MRLLLLAFFLSTSAIAANTSELIIAKKDNYDLMTKSYNRLQSLLLVSKVTDFCNLADKIVTTLYEIYDQDMELVQSLREHDNQDLYNYSLHISENSYTDFITINIFQNKCQQGGVLTALASFSRIYINLSYLKQTHRMWMNAFCPQLKGQCL